MFLIFRRDTLAIICDRNVIVIITVTGCDRNDAIACFHRPQGVHNEINPDTFDTIFVSMNWRHIVGKVELYDVRSVFVMEEIKRTTALPLHFLPGTGS